jgi:glucose-1-phosphate adenylyltransferase
MAEGVLGLIVTSGESSPLHGLGVASARALTPFAAQYRLLDFALATTANSGVRQVSLVSVADTGSARFPRILAACQRAVNAFEPEWLVVLGGDHILQVDIRPALDAMREGEADVSLLALPLRPDERHGHPTLTAVDGTELSWSGDFVVRTAVLPRLLRAFERPDTSNGHTDRTLRETVGVLVYDVARPRTSGPRLYWHDPASLEAYYASQMDLCTPEPALDLYDPSWPIRSVTSGLPPAKVTSDAACSHMGQAVNSLLADGCVIRGGAVIRSVVGPATVVETGAEIEDSILLDGCRIGKGAHVRRAVVGPGVVIADGEDVGYEEPVRPHSLRLPSGLTLLPRPEPWVGSEWEREHAPLGGTGERGVATG